MGDDMTDERKSDPALIVRASVETVDEAVERYRREHGRLLPDDAEVIEIVRPASP